MTVSTPERRLLTVDVFTEVATLGNPVAVVVDSDGLTDDVMRAVAAWTNLSETTFLFPPTDPAADYRVRIFTPTEELPFAGHPTLGSAAAWLRAGGTPRSERGIVQECGVGLIDIAQDGSGLAFAAPPLVRFGPPDAPTRSAVVASLGIADHHVVAMSWVHNGPAWIAALLDEPSTVARLRPATAAGLMIGAAAWHGEPGTGAGPGGTDLEVRAFFPVGDELREDPVTGSLNASLGQWLTGPDAPPTPWPTPSTYVARQGAALGRDGRVRIARRGDTVWVGGDCQIVVEGTLTL